MSSRKKFDTNRSAFSKTTIVFRWVYLLPFARGEDFHILTYTQIESSPIQLADEFHEYKNLKHMVLEHALYHRIYRTHIMIYVQFSKGQLPVHCKENDALEKQNLEICLMGKLPKRKSIATHSFMH